MCHCLLKCEKRHWRAATELLHWLSVWIVTHSGLFFSLFFPALMFSGMTAVICTYPLDMIRARLAFQVKGDQRYTGIANAFQTIYLKVTLWRRQHVFHKQWSLFINPRESSFSLCFAAISVFLLLKEGGVLGFYRGLTPTLIGMAPYAGD